MAFRWSARWGWSSRHTAKEAAGPRSVLLELRDAGMWLSDAVIARALRIARVKP
jgi:hypothetical protein